MNHEEATQYARLKATEVWRASNGNKEEAMAAFFKLIGEDEKLANACYIVQFRHAVLEQQTRH